MSIDQRAAAAAECQRLSHAFACLVDHGQADRVAELFTADGSFERRGERLVGREEIRKAISSRSAAVVSRHLCSTTFVDITSASTATGVTYFELHKYEWPDGQAAQGRVAPLGAPEVIGEYHDEFVLTAEGWRIRARAARGVFRREG